MSCEVIWNLSFKQTIALATLLNAAIVTYIAFQQYRTASAQRQLAEAKHRSDLFDRRFVVFQAVQKILSKVFENASCGYVDVHEFTPWTQQAYFLFNDDIYNYMLEIRSHLIQLASAEAQVKNNKDRADRQELLNSQHSAVVWLTDQLDTKKEGLFPKFKPYLRH